MLEPDRIGTDGAGPDSPVFTAATKEGQLPEDPLHYISKHQQQGIESIYFRLKKKRPQIGGFQSIYAARRTIQGVEAMLCLREGLCGRMDGMRA